ncbi:MAG TPA: DUF1801 domain-containing protein [Actinomycetes bacterium]|nr:DUF1801 domain-containing protein [Actinomycetes bacterium]
MSEVDDFLAALAPGPQSAFTHVVGVAMSEVPDAEQGTSYGMPALKHRGRPLLGFTEAKNHLSLFPFSPDVLDQVRDRLEGFSLARGTIRFSIDQPVPDDVVRDLVSLRRDEIDAKSKPRRS